MGPPSAHINVTMSNNMLSVVSLDDEPISVRSARSTASWSSDDTIVRNEDSALLSSKINYKSSMVDFEDDNDSSYTPTARRRPWIICLVVSGTVLL